MKYNILKPIAIALAIAFSAFTRPAKLPSSISSFKFFGDPTIASQVSNLSYWSVAAPELCQNFTNQDMACVLRVPDNYTHFDINEGIEVLNTFWDKPDYEQVLTINAAGSGYANYCRVFSVSSGVTILNGSNR